MEWLIAAGYEAVAVPGYNCGSVNTTEQEWLEGGNRNIYLGVIFILYGLIAEFLYVAVIGVMLKREFRRLSCYKIMLVLGFYDMFAIGVNSLLTGYLWLIGGSYCSHPQLIYVTGSIGLGLWCGACMNCLILVSNRLIDLWKPHLMPIFFGGHRTYLVLMIPLLYSVYFTLFTPPLLFNSTMTAWFFDPFIKPNQSEFFYNYPHTANNLLVVVATCVLYAMLCRVLIKKYKQNAGSSVTWAQKSTIIQSTAICMANLLASLIYVYMQFLPTANWMVLIGHISWQAGHGIPAFVYLLMNKTIQREVFYSLRFRRGITISSSYVTTHARSSKTMEV